MNINYSKIIANKRARNHEGIHTNDPIEFNKQLNALLTESADTVIKHLPKMLDTPLGASFVKYYVSTENMDLSSICDIVDNYHNIEESLSNKLQVAKSYQESMEWLRNDTKYQFAKKRYNATCLYESSYVGELELIGYNINTSPETITRYAKLIQKIELDNYSSVEQVFPELLKTNTELILGLRVVMTGQTANLLISLPTVIVKRLKNEGTKKQQKAFIKIIDKSIANMTAYLKTGDARHYNMYIAYLDNLVDAKKELMKTVSSSVTESSVFEHIADMQPDIVMYEDGVIEDPIAELEDALTDIVFDDCEEITESALINLTRIAHQIDTMYEVTTEAKSAHKGLRKVAYNVEDKARKAASKADTARKNTKRTAYALKKATTPFTTAVSRWVNEIKDMDRKERRERIVTNEFRLKLFKTLRKLITAIVSYNVGVTAALAAGSIPGVLGGLALTVISIIIGFAVDRHLDAKVRRQLMRELEEELAVVNEKLEDVRGDSNREKKYQLIRIKKKLEADLERVRFNLKSS